MPFFHIQCRSNQNTAANKLVVLIGQCLYACTTIVIDCFITVIPAFHVDMTYHCVCNNSNTTSAPSGSELLTVLPNHYFPVYCLCSVDHCLSFWPLYFLSFDLRLLNEYHFGIFQLFLDQCNVCMRVQQL
jgi:hypothetical protein